MRFEIDVTHRCNLACKYCNRIVGPLKIPDSDISVEDIVAAGEVLKHTKTKTGGIKISGGEALLHPQLVEICKAVRKEWKPEKITVFTNGILPRRCLKGLEVRIRISPPDNKLHRPFMVSPLDMGKKPKKDYPKPCRSMNLCGRAFDVFGFTFCPFAGVIGRMIGVDPYQSKPTSKRMVEICQHCIYTVSGGKRAKLEDGAESGGIECPSKTFREGLARHKEKPMKIKRFLDRLE